MSKRDLVRYLQGLSKAELQEQVQELYTRLKEVREFYDFVFNPKEDKLLDEAKFKISKEYFPPSGRKPKRRRSVAQKYIRTFLKLGVEPSLTADVMLHQLEIAQAYCAEKVIAQDAFYKSMLKSFKEAIEFIQQANLEKQFLSRLRAVAEKAETMNWINQEQFFLHLEKYKLL